MKDKTTPTYTTFVKRDDFGFIRSFNFGEETLHSGSQSKIGLYLTLVLRYFVHEI